MKLSTASKLLFTAALLVGTYTETGVFTTISMALVFVSGCGRINGRDNITDKGYKGREQTDKYGGTECSSCRGVDL